MKKNFDALEQKYLEPNETSIYCDSCERKLKSGDYYLERLGQTICLDCIKEELMVVD